MDNKQKIKKTVMAFPWYGGKNTHLRFLLPLIPSDGSINNFIDVFGGSGAVILNINECQVMTYNDINNDLVNLFRCLRDNYDELTNLLQLTPYSKKEYNICKELYNNEHVSDIERARRFFVRMRQSFAGTGLGGWSRGKTCTKNKAKIWVKNIDEKFEEIIERLRRIQIDNDLFSNIIKDYDCSSSFFYCDPPYIHGSRSHIKSYDYEMTNEDHQELAFILNNIKGRCMLSGYKNEIYNNLYKNWIRIDDKSRIIRSGTRPGKNDTSKRQESVWLNYEPPDLDKQNSTKIILGYQ